jgi:hypothetical protein
MLAGRKVMPEKLEIEVSDGWLRRPGLAEPFLGDRLGQPRGEREGRD